MKVSCAIDSQEQMTSCLFHRLGSSMNINDSSAVYNHFSSTDQPLPSLSTLINVSLSLLIFIMIMIMGSGMVPKHLC